MKKVILFLTILPLLVFRNESDAEDFRYLRTDEGLYSGEITSIAQDRAGKMWFATWTGVTSYDGFDFQFFRIKRKTCGEKIYA